MIAMSTTGTSKLIVRQLREADCPAVCRIWCDGLAQTTESCRDAMPFYLRPFRASKLAQMNSKMNEMKNMAMSEEGDIGPMGSNLFKTYNKPDRTMFVAHLEGDSSSDGDEVVVGCCAVKKGMDESKEQPESTEGSIWRMSVDGSQRGKSIGTMVMKECERYAKDQLGCASMGLYTVNPVAASFYVNRMGYTRGEVVHASKENWLGIEFELIPPVYKYVKNDL